MLLQVSIAAVKRGQSRRVDTTSPAADREWRASISQMAEYRESSTGIWTKTLLHEVGLQILDLGYHFAQVLSGYGVFRAYLHRMKRVESPLCKCGEPETAEHSIRHCLCFATGRVEVQRIDTRFCKYARRVVKQLWDNEVARICFETLISTLIWNIDFYVNLEH